MKLALSPFISLVFVTLSTLSAATGCTSQAPVAAPVRSTAADFSDPSWTPPDESGLTVDEQRLSEGARPVPREAAPRHEPTPNTHDAPRGSVRPAVAD